LPVTQVANPTNPVNAGAVIARIGADRVAMAVIAPAAGLVANDRPVGTTAPVVALLGATADAGLIGADHVGKKPVKSRRCPKSFAHFCPMKRAWIH
jgi:hypothetical protein